MNLVAGATGNVGGAVVRALLAANEPVRALVREHSGALPPGADQVLGDLNDPAGLSEAVRDVRAVFLLSGFTDMPNLLATIRAAGARRVVLLSGSSALATDPDNAVTSYMIRSERAVRESGLAWTILRPFAFMSNALRWADQVRAGDEIRLPFPTVRTAAIDPADIAAVAAQAMLTDDHDEKVHLLTGPESLLPADQVRILGDVLGRKLRCTGLSDAEAKESMSASMPAEYVAAFLSFYVDGTLDESPVLPTVADVLGRPPRTFHQWATDHATAFQLNGTS
jgi:uncharacterized protein YbjT (DUF2867 family)